MATRGSLSVEVDVVSDAEKFWGVLSDPTKFSKVIPDFYKDFQLIHGSTLGPGAVARVTYGKGYPVEVLEERMESVDAANKTYTYSVVGGLETLYKTFIGTFWVIPKVQGSTVKFSIEYEKINPEIPDPIDIKEFKVKSFQAIDAYLLKN